MPRTVPSLSLGYLRFQGKTFKSSAYPFRENQRSEKSLLLAKSGQTVTKAQPDQPNLLLSWPGRH